MHSRVRRKWLSFFISFTVLFISFLLPLQTYASIPSELRLFHGQSKQIKLNVPVTAGVSGETPEILKVKNSATEQSFQLWNNEPISLQSSHIGQTKLQLKLFGKIPFKTMNVNVVPNLRVIPGGQTIGVKMKSKGAMVVGHHKVETSDFQRDSSSIQGNIEKGDIITHINGKPLTDLAKVAPQIEQAGKQNKNLRLTIHRNGQTIEKEIKPLYNVTEKKYQLGVYIRDSAAGVGTLTFYAPDQGVYGALGHVITDLDTHQPVPVSSGEIIHSTVTSITKSHEGEPGEKRAHFFNEKEVIGSIERNTQFGIFGKMNKTPSHAFSQEAIPIAFSEEVKEGPAHIYTVLNGQKVEKFDIKITRVAKQTEPTTKGLVIKITDPRLLEMTGGIVQGMSGSPIIQNGKMVGAITHVFVNDVTSGYGCFIEWMLQDAGVVLNPHPHAEKSKAG